MACILPPARSRVTARVALILPLLASLFAWSLALVVAREQQTPADAATVVADAVEPRPPEGHGPVALLVPTVALTPPPTPSPRPAPVARAEPAARVVPPVSAAERAAVAAIIEAAAREFGQDAALLLKVANCESRLNPRAVGKAGEIGVFQFLPRTWAKNGARLGYSPADIWDARAQARVTAEMFGRAQQWQWTCARLVS